MKILDTALLALCLCILALRVTYTESPTAQVFTTMPGGLTDTIYSLTLSGLLVFAFISWLAVRLCGRGFTYHVIGVEFGLVLFVVAAAIATANASDKRAGITQTMVLLGPIAAALLLAQILRSDVWMRLTLAVVVALGIVSAYQAAEQFFLSNRIMVEQYEQDPNMLLGPLGIDPGTFQHFLFEHRIYSQDVRAFFTTSNSAASFAILASLAAVTIVAHRLVDRRAAGSPPRRIAMPALAAALVLTGLVLTQSKGGILAFVIGLAAFAAMVAFHKRLAAHPRLAATTLVLLPLLLIAAVGGAVAYYGLSHGSLPGGNSMLVRGQYWLASARMYADHPLTGVGPGNFSHYYPRYKPPEAPESVADPHNLVLSLAIQYGPLGLLGFLAMVFVPLWRSVACRDTGVSEDRYPPSSFRKPALLMLSIVGAALLIVRPMLIPATSAGGFVVVLYQIVTLYIAPAAVFVIGFLLIAAPMEEKGPHRSTVDQALLRAAMGGAILALLLHSMIDYAIFEPGVWMAFWIGMACVAAAGPRSETDESATRRLPPAWRAVAVVVALALLGLYSACVWWPVWQVTVHIRKAQAAAAVGSYVQAQNHLDAAAAADPLSGVAANLAGRLYVQQYDQGRRQEPRLLEKAAWSFRRAVELSPADYKNYEKLAEAYVGLRRWQEAYNSYLKATERYPGCERLWFRLARTAERLGRNDDALIYYAKAVGIEESYQRQFRRMYPERKKVVSRLGDDELRTARKRVEELSHRTDSQ